MMPLMISNQWDHSHPFLLWEKAFFFFVVVVLPASSIGRKHANGCIAWMFGASNYGSTNFMEGENINRCANGTEQRGQAQVNREHTAQWAGQSGCKWGINLPRFLFNFVAQHLTFRHRWRGNWFKIIIVRIRCNGTARSRRSYSRLCTHTIGSTISAVKHKTWQGLLAIHSP